METRMFEKDGIKLTTSCDSEYKIYNGRFINYNHCDIYADTINELLELFEEIVDENTRRLNNEYNQNISYGLC